MTMWWRVALVVVVGCGDGGSGVGSGTVDVGDTRDVPDAGADSAGDDVPGDGRDTGDAGNGSDAADARDGTGDAGDAGDAGDTGGDVGPDLDPGPLGVSLPQSLGGSLWVNPDVYPTIPVRVAATGSPDSVSVGVRGGEPAAAIDRGDGIWVAQLPVGRLGEGRIDVVAVALRGDEEVEAVAELHVGDQGVRITDFAEVGSGLTPDIHRRGDELLLSWTDRRAGGARGWLQALDGAGRFVGDRIQLTPDEHEATYARAAVGDTATCVLYQRLEGQTPFVNTFRVVDPQGEELLGPVGLNPSDRFGSYGGAVAWDGTGCVMTYRVNNGAAVGELYWRRWDVAGGLGIAVQIAAAGNNDPHGGFNPISFIDIAATPTHSAVTFVRQYWNTQLDTRVDKAQLRVLSPDGTVVHDGFVGRDTSFFWHHEMHVGRRGDALVPIWAQIDLLDPDPNPNTVLAATVLDIDNLPGPAGLAGQTLVNAPQNRGEPVFIEHREHFGVLAWTDERSYVDPLSGSVQLYFAPVDESMGALTAGEQGLIRHARFIAGTANLRGQEHGGNILLVWTDERHGSGLFDPRPEIYFETLWY